MVSPHDERIRALYAQEAQGRLARLSQLALALESRAAGEPPDPGTVAEMFREAHTLKGGAAAVGFGDVGRVAHALEDVLEQLRAEDATVSGDLIDGLLAGIEGLRTLIGAAARGDPHARQADGLETALRGVRVVGGRKAGAVEPPADQGTPVDGAAGHGDPGLTLAFRPPLPPEAPGSDRPTPPSAQPGTAPVGVDRLDELIRLASEAAGASLRMGSQLREEHGIDPLLLPEYRLLSALLGRVQEQGLQARMVPLASIVEPLHRAVRDQARGLGKLVRWEVVGEETALDRAVLQPLADGLVQVARNAVVHGIETPDERRAAGKPDQGLVRLHARQVGLEVVLTLSDDGRGVGPGATAADLTEAAGTGAGLDVVRTFLTRVRGRGEVHSVPGRGTEFRLFVPITLAVVSCLVVTAGAQRCALPLAAVTGVLAPQEAGSAEGRPIVWFGDRSVPLADLAGTLGVARPAAPDEDARAVVLLADQDPPYAFAVDALSGQRDLVVKELSPLLPRLEVIAGAALEPDGSVLLVLDPAGLAARARRAAPAPAATTSRPSAPVHPRGRVLVVDDALAVRELQRSILERAGYHVTTARDGVEALAVLRDQPQDLVLTDIEMPGMDGFSLVRSIRGHRALSEMPVVLLSSSDDDMGRRRGLEAGANAYVVKSDLDAEALRSTVERLLLR